MSKSFYITIFIFSLIVPLSFWCGFRAGKTDSLSELKAARQEIQVLRTYKTSREYEIVDGQRREDAFAEVVRMEMEERK